MDCHEGSNIGCATSQDKVTKGYWEWEDAAWDPSWEKENSWRVLEGGAWWSNGQVFGEIKAGIQMHWLFMNKKAQRLFQMRIFVEQKQHRLHNFVRWSYLRILRMRGCNASSKLREGKYLESIWRRCRLHGCSVLTKWKKWTRHSNEINARDCTFSSWS